MICSQVEKFLTQHIEALSSVTAPQPTGLHSVEAATVQFLVAPVADSGGEFNYQAAGLHQQFLFPASSSTTSGVQSTCLCEPALFTEETTVAERCGLGSGRAFLKLHRGE